MRVRAIDMRLRPPIPEWISGPTFKTAMWYPRNVSKFQGARSAWAESMDILFEEMDTTGVRYGVVMGRASSGQLGGGGVGVAGALGVEVDDNRLHAAAAQALGEEGGLLGRGAAGERDVAGAVGE